LASNGANAVCWTTPGGSPQATPSLLGTVFGCTQSGSFSTVALGHGAACATAALTGYGNVAVGACAAQCILGSNNVAVGYCTLGTSAATKSHFCRLASLMA
jgi:hypothetical protein